ncbi:MAG: hypothetical protein WCH99_14010 [Verrucomicrobiota bacterium]
MSNIIDAIPLPPVYYHATEASYWRGDHSGRWIKINESYAKNFIADYGYSKCPEVPGANSEVESCVMRVQERQNIAYAGSLAGHDAGFYRAGENQILVTDSPMFITPKAGTWPTLNALFSSMLDDDEISQCSQWPYFMGWIKSAMNSFRARRWTASQMLAMAGPVGSGKSLTQNLLTVMFGGRCAKPYQFMMGATNFNAHMFGAEHQVLEDESERVDIRSRRNFAANIKTILTGRDQNCHGKNKTALILQPRWRMSLSLNDDAERLQVLPPLDSDVRDKIIILKAHKADMPLPTGTPELDAVFWNTMVAELPAFLHAIDQWEIPAELADARYGIRAYHHPEIVAKLEQTAPELRLMELIDRVIFGVGEPVLDYSRVPAPFVGSAMEIENKLVGKFSTVQYEARNLLTWQNATGAYLGRLRESTVDYVRGRVASRIRMGQTIWTIQPPVREEAQAPVPDDEQGLPEVPEGISDTEN